ncbi:tRNA (cytidine(34)-2'-O)-methyltransferase [Allorhodopirellula solitaria]|uniref:Putative tRNA (cytidine(34)-2'-O)-methyltransferase n=1 Tax=Allorhodopirellula solitaria TaxID=2527987 RepID=A0A5C5YHI7_9BACT|nr:tRNA (cytidine(34)-2'-O)-methyltransferase [Allorhodopirellula solitaria]TWT72922.1 tRNA (cytidine(34)-2'-O)-methyltransferase [Allorhodopirellula solitaria]
MSNNAENPIMTESSANETPAHVVLYQPEIPQNTGNIGRTCVAVGAKLWIVQPAAFSFEEKRLRRAGLDYWQHLDIEMVPDWQALTERLDPARFYFLSRFAKRTLWDAPLQRGDVFVFGRETSGLPDWILDPDDERAIGLPTRPVVRSLNLATTAGIVLFEHQRRLAVGN